MLVRFADTDSDITIELAKKYNCRIVSMPYVFNGEEVFPYETWEKFDDEGFYEALRTTKELPSTSAISPEKYREYFEPEFAAGNDIFYVHFSPKISGTFNAMRLAVNELLEKYPERKFHTLDTKGISATALNVLEDVFAYLDEGHTVEEAIEYGEKVRDFYATYFFADDLKFFAKSGRVSGMKAVFGGMLGIKPIISITDEGVMTSIGTAKGKLNAIKYLVDKYGELCVEPGKVVVKVIHAGAPKLAEAVKEALVAKYGEMEFDVYPLNPTAGCHAGPNTCGISFKAKHR